jgi:DNA invertase Pin-like site-specific DNA recombinase
MRKSIEHYQQAYTKFKTLNDMMNRDELAKTLGVDPTTISAWRRGRTPDSHYGQVNKDVLDAAKNLLEQEYPYKEVARYLSVDYHTLQKHFPGMGWKGGPVKRVEFSVDEYV